jgi:GNAT superfamily N-acetyltransferase
VVVAAGEVAAGIGVRRAGTEDYRTLAELRYAWLAEEDHREGSGREKFADELSRWLIAHHESHLGFLALVDGEAVGIAFLALIERIPGPGEPSRRAGHVQSVFVRGDRRDRGVGSALMQRIVDEARSLGLDYLLLHPTVRARSFYRRLGFLGDDRLLELRLDGRH